jgi:hypothetical protein
MCGGRKFSFGAVTILVFSAIASACIGYGSGSAAAIKWYGYEPPPFEPGLTFDYTTRLINNQVLCTSQQPTTLTFPASNSLSVQILTLDVNKGATDLSGSLGGQNFMPPNTINASLGLCAVTQFGNHLR